MNKITSKFNIAAIIILFILSVIFTIFSFAKSYIYDDKDACVDSGICKKGLKVIINSKEIEINKDTCIDNKGQWREQYNGCWFKN